MRLNAATMTRQDFNTYMIYDYDGNEVHCCEIADSDEGYALCMMHTMIDGNIKLIISYDEDVIVHTYMLHSFVIKNKKTDEIVAKV